MIISLVRCFRRLAAVTAQLVTISSKQDGANGRND